MQRAKHIVVVILAAVLGAVSLWLYQAGRRVLADRREAGPTLEQVQQLARLVTLSVTVSDVQVKNLEGYTGGLRLVLLVRGSVEIGSNLLNAYFAQIDPVSKRAVLALPPPIATRPCLDQQRTRIWTIQRTGLWQILPSSAGEAELANRALRQAQQVVEEAGRQPALLRGRPAADRGPDRGVLRRFGLAGAGRMDGPALGAEPGLPPSLRALLAMARPADRPRRPAPADRHG